MKTKPYCVRGHAFVEGNYSIRYTRKTTSKVCLLCHRVRNRLSYQRSKRPEISDEELDRRALARLKSDGFRA